MVGYDSHSDAYRVYLPSERKIILARNRTFNEIRPGPDCLVQPATEATVEGESNPAETRSKLEEDNDSDFTRPPSPPKRPWVLRPRSTMKPPERLVQPYYMATEPNSFKEAINSPESAHWKTAIENELTSHANNGTMRIVEQRTGKRLLTNRCVFKLKKDANGDIQSYKARLCVRGNTQRPGMDYGQTFPKFPDLNQSVS